MVDVLTKPFSEGKELLKKIENANHQAYFVGGCVRDLLLKREIGDIDIATSASPAEIQQLFPKVIPVGMEHGTVIVRHNHISYEVTTFRLDGKYTDQRHPDTVQFIDKVDQDLKRRDFTINALAMDRDGFITDLFNGKDDLDNKTIRTVGNGYERFTEDPLRIVRALRFSSQLGFTIENETLVNMKQLKQEIETISIERITNECSKLFSGKYVNNGIKYLIETETYKHLPVMLKYPYIIHKLPKQLQPFHSFAEVLALFHYLEPNISIMTWIKAWKCSNKTKKETIHLMNAIQYYENNGLDEWLVYELPSLYYHSFVSLVNHLSLVKVQVDELIQIEAKLTIHSKQELAIKGNEIIALFPHTKKGPWIHDTISQMEKEVVMKKVLNRKFDLKEWIRWHPPEIN